MADSVRETALKALFGVLSGLSGPAAYRNGNEVGDIPNGGLIVVRDGDPGDPEVTLSPPTYSFEHRAEIIVQVQARTALLRDAAMDLILIDIGDAISADLSLGGTVNMATLGGPEIVDEAVEGAETIKACLIPVILEYDSTNPLG